MCKEFTFVKTWLEHLLQYLTGLQVVHSKHCLKLKPLQNSSQFTKLDTACSTFVPKIVFPRRLTGFPSQHITNATGTLFYQAVLKNLVLENAFKLKLVCRMCRVRWWRSWASSYFFRACFFFSWHNFVWHATIEDRGICNNPFIATALRSTDMEFNSMRAIRFSGKKIPRTETEQTDVNEITISNCQHNLIQ